jgi:hypothetical protein
MTPRLPISVRRERGLSQRVLFAPLFVWESYMTPSRTTSPFLAIRIRVKEDGKGEVKEDLIYCKSNVHM